MGGPAQRITDDARHDVKPRGRARRAVPVRAREVRPRAGPAARAGARAGRHDRLQPARHPRQRAHTSRSTTTAPPASPTRTWTLILVHCDPRFARLEETFKPSVELTVPVHYTGFVTRNGHARSDRGEHIVVSAGGGRVGTPLLEEAIKASDGRPMRAIAGPLMPQDDFEALAGARAAQRRARCARSPTSPQELSRARASISQCGYNTALDLLRTRVPALVVPYATPEEDEQTRRARRLEQLGVLKVADAHHGDIDALLRLHPAPPRSTSTARPRPRSCC